MHPRVRFSHEACKVSLSVCCKYGCPDRGRGVLKASVSFTRRSRISRDRWLRMGGQLLLRLRDQLAEDLDRRNRRRCERVFA